MVNQDEAKIPRAASGGVETSKQTPAGHPSSFSNNLSCRPRGHSAAAREFAFESDLADGG